MLSLLRLPRPALTVPAIIAAVRFPWLWLLATIPAATLWTALFLSQNNLEVQSIDLCHYAMWVDHLQTPFGEIDHEFVGQYPMMSLRVAALWMPLFDNPIMAVRAAALTCLLIMFVSQWFLLRTQLPPPSALLALIAWQCLCTTCKLGDANHFLWEWTYNYSRAASATAMWVMILTFVVPPSQYRAMNLLVAIGLAAFAFRCHIAAGSLALAACGTWCVVNLLRRDWLLGLGGLIGLGITSACLLIFTDEWRYLASLQHDNCQLAIRHENLIALWIPTAIIGLGIALWKFWRKDLELTLTTAILCGLLPAAVLQGYMLYGKNVTHTIGGYPYNQMLFYTFGFTTLLWLIAILGAMPMARGGHGQTLRFTKVVTVLAAMWGLYVILEKDARRERVPKEHDPVEVVKRLKPMRDQFAGCYYYDPQLEHASYFVTRCVLGRDSGNAARYRLHCHLRKPNDLFSEKELKGVFMPLSVDVEAIINEPPCEKRQVGDFWFVDLEHWRAAGPNYRMSMLPNQADTNGSDE